MGEFIKDQLPDPVGYYESEGLTLQRGSKWRTTRCEFHGGSDSMRINTESGAFVCMAACGAKGSDVLAYHMAAHGMGFVEAAKALGAYREDDPADTLLPRLIAAGADRARCYFVQGTRIDGEIDSFDPARDMAALEAKAQQIGGVKLLIVDPVVSAVAGDSHKNTEVRRALQPLVDLASRLDAAALGISHFSKGGAGADPASRVVGSIAFTAVARVVLVAAKVKPEDGEDNKVRRILARGKSNIGPDDGGFEYDIDQTEALPGITASRVMWGQAVQGTARELLTDPDELGDDAGSDTADLLKAELTADGWTNADAASLPLKSAGFTKKQIWTASKKLRVIRKKLGMKGPWMWRLPGQWQADQDGGEAEDSAEDSEGSNIRNVESWNLRMESSTVPAIGESEVL